MSPWHPSCLAARPLFSSVGHAAAALRARLPPRGRPVQRELIVEGTNEGLAAAGPAAQRRPEAEPDTGPARARPGPVRRPASTPSRRSPACSASPGRPSTGPLSPAPCAAPRRPPSWPGRRSSERPEPQAQAFAGALTPDRAGVRAAIEYTGPRVLPCAVGQRTGPGADAGYIRALERPQRANGSPRLRRRGRLARADNIEAGHGPAPSGWHVAASEHDDGAADDGKRPAAFGEFLRVGRVRRCRGPVPVLCPLPGAA